MKKKFTTLFLFAATMLLTLTLGSCGEEVVIDNPNSKGTTEFTTDKAEAFDATRTSVNNKRWFFWEPGDKIWVLNNGTWIDSNPTEITSTQSKAKFVFNEILSDPAGYKVAYTGKNATSATQVTIAHKQSQATWNDGSHIGTSGDCGVATAARQENGTYKFALEHKAAYLLFYPYMGVTGNYTLKKIEIFGDGQQIAGTFDFGPNVAGGGLADLPIAGTAKDSITLSLGTSGLLMSNVVPDLASTTQTFNHCFIVIAPGTHELTIKYTAENSSGSEIAFIKDIEATKYDANGVYTFVHELKDAVITIGDTFRETNTFYQWGASSQWVSSTHVYNTQSSGDLTSNTWATLCAYYNSSDNIPNNTRNIRNYTINKPYWDNATEWRYVRKDGTTEVRRGGAWIKKRAHITTPYTTSSRNAPIIGRPDATVLSQYFFLPAFRGINATTYFWTKTAINTNVAYAFYISKADVGIDNGTYKHNPCSPWKNIGNGAQTWWE